MGAESFGYLFMYNNFATKLITIAGGIIGFFFPE